MDPQIYYVHSNKSCMVVYYLLYTVGYNTFRLAVHTTSFDIHNIIFRDICFYITNWTLDQVFCLWLCMFFGIFQAKYIVGFEVLTAVVMKNNIFWDTKSCSPLKLNRRFGGTYRLHLQVRKISQTRTQRESTWQSELGWFSTRNLEAICSSETSVVFQRTTRRYIPEHSTLLLALYYKW
jgi:hypothetical protein